MGSTNSKAGTNGCPVGKVYSIPFGQTTGTCLTEADHVQCCQAATNMINGNACDPDYAANGTTTAMSGPQCKKTMDAYCLNYANATFPYCKANYTYLPAASTSVGPYTVPAFGGGCSAVCGGGTQKTTQTCTVYAPGNNFYGINNVDLVALDPITLPTITLPAFDFSNITFSLFTSGRETMDNPYNSRETMDNPYNSRETMDNPYNSITHIYDDGTHKYYVVDSNCNNLASYTIPCTGTNCPATIAPVSANMPTTTDIQSTSILSPVSTSNTPSNTDIQSVNMPTNTDIQSVNMPTNTDIQSVNMPTNTQSAADFTAFPMAWLLYIIIVIVVIFGGYYALPKKENNIVITNQ